MFETRDKWLKIVSDIVSKQSELESCERMIRNELDKMIDKHSDKEFTPRMLDLIEIGATLNSDLEELEKQRRITFLAYQKELSEKINL